MILLSRHNITSQAGILVAWIKLVQVRRGTRCSPAVAWEKGEGRKEMEIFRCKGFGRQGSLASLLLLILVGAWGCKPRAQDALPAPGLPAPPAQKEAAGPPPPSPASKPAYDVTISARDWDVDHTMILLALERGYFAKEGINVKLAYSAGNAADAVLVANGTSTFAVIGTDVTMVSVSQGMPLKQIYSIYQKSPRAIISLAERNIRAPKDVEGRKLGVSPASDQASLNVPFLEANGVNLKKVSLTNVGWDAAVPSLISGQIDAYANWCAQIPIILIKKGLHPTCIMWRDFGFNSLHKGIIANSNVVKNQPEMIRGFLKAVGRGHEEIRNNPQAHAPLMRKYCPDCDPDTELQRLEITVDAWQSDRAKAQNLPLGVAAAEDWEDTKKILVENKLIDGAFLVEAYYDYSLMPK